MQRPWIGQVFNVIAELMFWAIRLGGQPCSLLPRRWGYGGPGCAFAASAEIPLSYSNIKVNENVVFFDGTAWLGPARGGGGHTLPGTGVVDELPAAQL